MTLNQGDVGAVYVIQGIDLEQNHITRRLEALGLNEFTKIQILNKKRGGAFIIKVRGTRLAVGRDIACGIRVGKEDSHE